MAAPLLKGECTATKMAVYLYVGPYEKVGLAYGKIMEFVDAERLQAGRADHGKIPGQDPDAVKPEELRTEINVPVEKK